MGGCRALRDLDGFAGSGETQPSAKRFEEGGSDLKHEHRARLLPMYSELSKHECRFSFCHDEISTG